MDLITAIRNSLTVFVCGIIGLIPILGLIPAVYSLVSWIRVRRAFRNQWNPASVYLNGGAVLALFGVLSSILVIVFAVMSLVSLNFG
jgi:hypothetical protein